MDCDCSSSSVFGLVHNVGDEKATERAVSEHPVVFSAWSVRRILAGAKTQTRRVCKWNEVKIDLFRRGFLDSPYGKAGDLLWVREPLVKVMLGFGSFSAVAYEANRYDDFPVLAAQDGEATTWPWKRDRLPAIFCPRWASRLTLRVTGVWVERLVDITRQDAVAEGVEPFVGNAVCPDHDCYEVWRFLTIWDELNAKRGYPTEANPWVWATEFEVVP